MDYVEDNSSIHVGPSHNLEIDETAKDIMSTGIKYKDACHEASAMIAGCEYLITTDKRLLNYKSEKLNLINPVQFVDEMEEREDE